MRRLSIHLEELLFLYDKRCRCISIFKPTNRSEGRSLPYIKDIEFIECFEYKDYWIDLTYFTFKIKYEKELSSIAKLILNSFQKKYIYYAIDDILYLLKSNPIERDNLLSIIYSSVISLQNNFSINFFDIWIHEIYINVVSKVNKFITNYSQNFEQFSYITIKFFYTTRIPLKKPEPLW